MVLAARKALREKIEERQGLMIPSEDPDQEHLGEAYPPWATPEWEAILQPPKPEIQPAAKILEAARDHDAAPEAAS